MSEPGETHELDEISDRSDGRITRQPRGRVEAAVAEETAGGGSAMAEDDRRTDAGDADDADDSPTETSAETAAEKAERKAARKEEKRAAKEEKQLAKAARRTVKREQEARAAALADDDVAVLEGLDGAYDRSPRGPVAELLSDAAELAAAARKYKDALIASTRLKAADLKALAKRAALAERAQAAWTMARTAGLDRATRRLHDEAEALGEELAAALRYFVDGNGEVRRALDEIHRSASAGAADVAQDLRRLASLAEAHAERLVDADLPGDAAARARELAEALLAGRADEGHSDEARRAAALRNRSVAWLVETMDQVRAAGRYALRDKPKARARFRAAHDAPHATDAAPHDAPPVTQAATHAADHAPPVTDAATHAADDAPPAPASPPLAASPVPPAPPPPPSPPAAPSPPSNAASDSDEELAIEER